MMSIVKVTHHGRLELGLESREPGFGLRFHPLGASDLKPVPEPLCLTISAPAKQR